MAKKKAKEKKKTVTLKIPNFPQINPWMASTVALVILSVILVVLLFNFPTTGRALSAEEAANKAVDYLNNNILRPGQTAELLNVRESGGLYNLKLKIGARTFDSYVTKDGSLLFPSAIDLTQIPEIPKQPETTIGNFKVSEDPICTENGKPAIYFFGSERCPHCAWEHPIFENVTEKFEGYISFHNNMDSDADRDIFSKYSTGGIPTLVLGCKYYRVGSGESMGQAQETEVLTALICKLTENNPTDVCSEVQSLVSQIREGQHNSTSR